MNNEIEELQKQVDELKSKISTLDKINKLKNEIKKLEEDVKVLEAGGSLPVVSTQFISCNHDYGSYLVAYPRTCSKCGQYESYYGGLIWGGGNITSSGTISSSIIGGIY